MIEAITVDQIVKRYNGLVALDDVCVSAIGPRYQGGSWNEPQLVSQQVFDNLKVGRRMTIDNSLPL